MSIQDIKNKVIGFVNGTTTTATSSSSGADFLPLNGNQAEIEGNNDSYRGKATQSKYDLIKDILREYRISPQDAEKCGLLENIAGCSREELEKMDEEHFNNVVRALKEALGVTGDWEWFWNDRDVNDINKIIKDANKRLTSSSTGGNWFQQKIFEITTKDSLVDELKDFGIEISETQPLKEGIKLYIKEKHFKGMTPEELSANYDPEKINKFYDNALRAFGNFLNKYESPEDKAVIISVIEMLKADQRKLAGNVALQSCQNDPTAKETVAVAIDTNAMYIAGKRDAFGEQMSQEDNIELRTSVYDNMSSEENRKASYQRMRDVAEEYQALLKKEAEGTLSEDEKARLNELRDLNAEELYIVGGYSAATISVSKRTENDPNAKDELAFIQDETAELGYQDSVLKTTSEYIENNPDVINMTKNEFENLMNNATGNKYSEVTTNNKINNNNNNTETQNTNNNETIGFASRKAVNTDRNTELLENLYAQNRTTVNNQAVEISQVNVNNEVENNQNNEKNDIEKITELLKNGNIDAVYKYIRDNGVSETILEIFNNFDQINSPMILSYAIDLFKNIHSTAQEKILKAVNNMTITQQLLKAASYNTLKNVNFTNAYLRDIAQDNIRIKEENNKSLALNNI